MIEKDRQMQQFDWKNNFLQQDIVPFDTNLFIRMQRKNMMALSEIQNLMIERLQSTTQLQAEVMSKLMENNSKFASELMSVSSPEEKISRQTAMVKEIGDKSLKNIKEISQLLSKSNKQVATVVNKSVASSIEDLQELVTSSTKQAA